jgi:hypothetical protein
MGIAENEMLLSAPKRQLNWFNATSANNKSGTDKAEGLKQHSSGKEKPGRCALCA